MLLAHVVTTACSAERNVVACMGHAARKVRRAASAEISHSRALVGRLADGLYELVDRQARERYEGKRPLS
jgi:hypothetical protein